MLTELINAHTLEALDAVAIQLLGNEAFRQLQEEMVREDIAFVRGDYWPEDVLDRRTLTVNATQKTLKEVAEEPMEKRLLHLLQIITKTSPGAANGVKRFLKRVTFG